MNDAKIFQGPSGRKTYESQGGEKTTRSSYFTEKERITPVVSRRRQSGQKINAGKVIFNLCTIINVLLDRKVLLFSRKFFNTISIIIIFRFLCIYCAILFALHIASGDDNDAP